MGSFVFLFLVGKDQCSFSRISVKIVKIDEVEKKQRLREINSGVCVTFKLLTFWYSFMCV